MSTILLALLLAIQPTTSTQPAPKPIGEPVTAEIQLEGDPWKHDPSGVSFPLEVAGFSRRKGYMFQDDRSNVGILYRYDDPRITCDVYVYPHDDGDLIEHFKAAARDVLRSWKDAKILRSEEKELPLGNGPNVRVAFAHFTLLPRAGDDQRLRYSELYLCKHGKFWVKYRFTGLDADREDIKKATGEFLAWFELPRQ